MPRFSSKVEKAETNGSADYLKPLHPGTYCLPKRACLKPFTQESLFLDDHKLSLIERSSKAKKSFEKAFSHSCHNKVMSLPWYPSLTSASPIKGSNNESPRSVKKTVSFDSVEIRQYERQPGCNPSVSQGVPIAIGWNVVDSNIIRLDEYEGRVSQTRRTKNQLLLSPEERERLLKDIWGYSFKEILGATTESKEAKTKRLQTISRENFASFISLSKLEEIKESSGRKFYRLFRRKKEDVQDLMNQTEARRQFLELKPKPIFTPSFPIGPSLIQDDYLLDDQKLILCRRTFSPTGSSSRKDQLNYTWHSR